MFKKLSAFLFTLALVACVIAPAQAQNTLALYGDTGQGLSRHINVSTGVAFDVVAVMKIGEQTNAAEFVMTELRVLFPGVLSTGTTKLNNALDLGNNGLGEYLLAFLMCVPVSSSLEPVRVQYLDFQGLLPNDIVLGLRGFQPGDTRPSTFNGEPGFVDCAEGKFPLSLEPWVDFDIIDPTKLVTVDSADGVMAINSDVIPNEVSSMGSLKSRF
jgi:hypothetical protein